MGYNDWNKKYDNFQKEYDDFENKHYEEMQKYKEFNKENFSGVDKFIKHLKRICIFIIAILIIVSVVIVGIGLLIYFSLPVFQSNFHISL